MKNQMLNMAIAALCMLAATSFVSCSDDDDPTLKVTTQTSEKGISAIVFDHIYSLNVETAGEWQASLPKECNWARLMQTKGKGNAEIKIVVDCNNTGIERSTSISITSGSEKIEVALKQASYIGSAPSNDAEFIMLAGSKYIGFGCDLMEFYDNPSTNELRYKACNVFNTAGIYDLMNQDPAKYDAISTTTPISSADYEDAKLDTIISKKDSLSVRLKFDIAYGLMKFGISGKYHGKEEMKSDYTEIQTAANYPTMQASINYLEAISHYNKWIQDGCPENDSRGSITTSSFSDIANELKEECAKATPNQTDIDEIIEEIIENFGTGVITKSKLGGMIAIDVLVDNKYIDENYGVDTAKVTAEIKAGLFSLKADIQVDYIDDATRTLNNSKHKIKVIGGSDDKIAKIINMMDSAKYDMPLANAITDWSMSLVNSNDDTNNAELISIEAVPIWDVFKDRKSKRAIKAYFLEHYKGSKFVQHYLGK